MTSMAPGTVIVTSTMGMPLLETASAAKRASSVEDKRIAGMIPMSSMILQTCSLSMWLSIHDHITADATARICELPRFANVSFCKMSFHSQLNHVIRRLLRAPMFSFITLLTLAIGIGANTAIFSVISGVLLKPLPYLDADRLVGVWQTAP